MRYLMNFVFLSVMLLPGSTFSEISPTFDPQDETENFVLSWSKCLREEESSRSEVSARFSSRSRLTSSIWSEKYRCEREEGEFSYGTIIENCLKRFDTYYCTATVTVYCRRTGEDSNE